MKALVAAAIVAWVGGSIAALAGIWRAKSEPGQSGPALETWPLQSALHPSPDRATVVVVLHPKCPCARATVQELEGILCEASDKADLAFLIYRPEEDLPGSERTDVFHRASLLPRSTLHADAGGREALAFGARTSGHVFVYGRDGRLRFSGGVTGSRGHVGDNPGRQAVTAALKTGAAPVSSGPVFGCPIVGDEERTGR